MYYYRKTLTLLSFLSLFTNSSFAQDKVQGIIVELSTGEKVEYRLVDHPKLVFDGETITLTANGVMVEYNPAELLKVTTGEVDNTGNDIADIVANKGDITFESGFVRLRSFTAGTIVNAYTIGGTEIASWHIADDGTLAIPIASLPQDITIIKIINQSIKITKR